MPLSDIPIGIAPIFRRRSSTEPVPGDRRADETHARETVNESPAPIPAPAPTSDDAPAPATTAPASAGGQDEPATSAPVVLPSLSPEPTWDELIEAAEKRSAAPAPDAEQAPRAIEDRIAAAEEFPNLDFSEPKPEPPQRREVRREANGAPVPRAAEQLHVSGAERAIWRHGCNWLQLFHLCRRSRCRHAGECRGEPAACLCAGVQHAPDSVRQFVIRMIKAQELGLSFDEAFEDAADYQDAYFAWVAGLEAAQRR